MMNWRSRCWRCNGRLTKSKVPSSSTPAAKNQPAIQLYQTQGYTIVQSTTLPDGLELILLQKEVNR
jgi:hypothetical protein